MRDLARLRERFLRDSPDRRLGNLASDLLRLSTWLRMRRDEGAGALMREIAWMIEWSGDHATEELVDIQRELCRWRRIWPMDSARSLLAFRAKQMSDHVLIMSGLAESSEPDPRIKQVDEIGNVVVPADRLAQP